jgi:hypothetical protein
MMPKKIGTNENMKPIKTYILDSYGKSKANIRLVDDRSKHDNVEVTKILYEDEYYILGEVHLQPVLIRKKDREVLTSNYQFFYAENY